MSRSIKTEKGRGAVSGQRSAGLHRTDPGGGNATEGASGTNDKIGMWAQVREECHSHVKSPEFNNETGDGK